MANNSANYYTSPTQVANQLNEEHMKEKEIEIIPEEDLEEEPINKGVIGPSKPKPLRRSERVCLQTL